MIRNWRGDGLYYWTWKRFSLNESRFPNIHVQWWPFFLYVALSKRWKLIVGGH